jgi:hypothetical protein
VGALGPRSDPVFHPEGGRGPRAREFPPTAYGGRDKLPAPASSGGSVTAEIAGEFSKQ